MLSGDRRGRPHKHLIYLIVKPSNGSPKIQERCFKDLIYNLALRRKDICMNYDDKILQN